MAHALAGGSTSTLGFGPPPAWRNCNARRPRPIRSSPGSMIVLDLPAPAMDHQSSSSRVSMRCPRAGRRRARPSSSNSQPTRPADLDVPPEEAVEVARTIRAVAEKSRRGPPRSSSSSSSGRRHARRHRAATAHASAMIATNLNAAAAALAPKVLAADRPTAGRCSISTSAATISACRARTPRSSFISLNAVDHAALLSPLPRRPAPQWMRLLGTTTSLTLINRPARIWKGRYSRCSTINCARGCRVLAYAGAGSDISGFAAAFAAPDD